MKSSGGPTSFANAVRAVDARRRERMTYALARVMAIAAGVLSIGTFMLLDEDLRLPLSCVVAGMGVLCVVAARLARSGKGTAGAMILVGLPCLGAWLTVVATQRIGAGPFYIGLGFLVALVTMQGPVLRRTLFFAVACELSMLVVASRMELHAPPPPIVLFNAAILAVLMALIVWTHSRMFSRVLTQVANQRAKVAEAQAQLEQMRKMEALGRFAGSIAHDFNNILSVMQGCVTLVDQGLPRESALRGDVTELQDSISRAGSLTSQLLAFSRRDRVNPVRVDTAPLLQRLSEFAQRLVGDKVKVELRIEEGVWPLWAGPSQVDQLIMNLAANSRDAMPDGGSLTISAKNAPRSQVGDAVLLTVIDTGAGMPPETLARAFEPFFTTKPAGIGTGLGLATVFGVVKALGGEVVAESEEGRGTVVSMWLPRAPDEAAVPVATTPGPRSQLPV